MGARRGVRGAGEERPCQHHGEKKKQKMVNSHFVVHHLVLAVDELAWER